ncbi:MAG: zinc-dependent alcohol dehydrogenase family protein [candidate division WOR-3 bacterium]|nr:MAG: zinc-dependent alcohol dehydrogenase family protein [candidate division WOR-3 bacterium]
MRAMQLQRPARAEDRPLSLVETAVPEPGDDEVRIRIRACGVCHTDLHEVEGDLPLPRLPLIPGHEIVGVVDKLGSKAPGPDTGTVVGVPWLNWTCGRCRYCRSGRENLCERIRFTGYSVDGGYAEYAVVPSGFCYPLSDSLDPIEAAPLLCAGVIGYRALRLAGVHGPGSTRSSLESSTTRTPGPLRLGLYGFGASAHICLQIARHWNCRTAVFTRADKHKQLARGLGADWVGEAGEDPPWPLDSSIAFAPAGDIVPKALRMLDRAGTLALAGIHMSPIPEMPYDLIYHERTVRSVANSTRQDVRDLLRLAVEVPIRTTVEEYPLEQANDALLAVKHSRTEAAAVLKVGG